MKRHIKRRSHFQNLLFLLLHESEFFRYVWVAEQDIEVGEQTTHAGESQEKNRRKNCKIKGEISQKVKLRLNETEMTHLQDVSYLVIWLDK